MCKRAGVQAEGQAVRFDKRWIEEDIPSFCIGMPKVFHLAKTETDQLVFGFSKSAWNGFGLNERSRMERLSSVSLETQKTMKTARERAFDNVQVGFKKM